MPKAIEITAQNFAEEVLNSDIPVLVDFWAPWCQPCLMMSPILDELAGEMDGKVKIGKLNTEIQEHMPLAIQYDIRSIPNMKLFKSGKVVKEFIGMRPIDVLEMELKAAL